MISETDYILSFYQPLSTFGDKPNVELVKNTSTGQLYVKKTLSVYDRTVFDYIFRFHPQNVPKIIELLEDNGELIVIEEYISGRSLREILNERGSLSVQEVRALIISLINILIPFHSLNPPIVHRDIKPENLLISSDGMLKLIDFNAAKVSAPGKKRDTELFGTHGYAAPEQYGFSASTPATDIYAIGILITELSTGKMDPAAVPPALYFAAERCTRMDPAARYHSIFELLADLQSQSRTGAAAEHSPTADHFPAAERFPAANPVPAESEATSRQPQPAAFRPSPQENAIRPAAQTDAFRQPVFSPSHDVQSLSSPPHAAQSLSSPSRTAQSHSSAPETNPQQEKSRRKWLPPGFRTGVWWKMVIGSLGYALILLITYAGGSTQTNLPARLIEYALVFVPSFASVAILFNYGGLWKHLPLLKSDKPALRILGLILYPAFNVAATLLLLILIGMAFDIKLAGRGG